MNITANQYASKLFSLSGEWNKIKNLNLDQTTILTRLFQASKDNADDRKAILNLILLIEGVRPGVGLYDDLESDFDRINYTRIPKCVIDPEELIDFLNKFKISFHMLADNEFYVSRIKSANDIKNAVQNPNYTEADRQLKEIFGYICDRADSYEDISIKEKFTNIMLYPEYCNKKDYYSHKSQWDNKIVNYNKILAKYGTECYIYFNEKMGADDIDNRAPIIVKCILIIMIVCLLCLLICIIINQFWFNLFDDQSEVTNPKN